jgi:methyl-accepting chemotaxis protein
MQMAAANEHVKEVLRISAEVNLVALNAMLAAHSAGEGSRGFGVVSSELRGLSRGLDREMLKLVETFSGVVRDTAVLQKQRHILGLLHAASRGERATERLGGLLRRKESELLEADQAIRAKRQHVENQVERTLRLCATGHALARSAKIEAVYGGAMVATLRQVANQIEDAVGQILAALRQIQFQMAR